MNNTIIIKANITKCCHVGIMSIGDKDYCKNCEKVITEKEVYQVELTEIEAWFFDVI